jgi:hypothetical protein
MEHAADPPVGRIRVQFVMVLPPVVPLAERKMYRHLVLWDFKSHLPND